MNKLRKSDRGGIEPVRCGAASLQMAEICKADDLVPYLAIQKAAVDRSDGEPGC
jgi:hypothetical protein